MVESIDEVKDWETKVMQSSIPVVVDFWAEWCEPCKIIVPIIEDLEKEYKNKVKFVKVDVDKAQELSSKYKIYSIPVVGVFINGKLIDQTVGATSKDKYKKLITKALNK